MTETTPFQLTVKIQYVIEDMISVSLLLGCDFKSLESVSQKH